jgi:hypothetical protein
MILDLKNINIKPGKSYKLSVPDYCCDPIKVHIDYILKNPISDLKEDNLIVLRYWVKHKKTWRHKVYEYWHLHLYNDGKFGSKK